MLSLVLQRNRMAEQAKSTITMCGYEDERMHGVFVAGEVAGDNTVLKWVKEDDSSIVWTHGSSNTDAMWSL